MDENTCTDKSWKSEFIISDVLTYSATEKILLKCRQIVDMKKDDGFAPLHLASLNGHRDVTNTLLVTVSINIY